MAVNNEVLAIILGGGQGTRLFPLTQHRSKPAVPIGGKYRLIDIPISNCLHADIRRIFVLTQFNSASLNRHIAQTYRMDLFSQGFVEILAAEQTPDNPNWFQGTADAVRQAARHFVALRRRLLPDPRRRSSLPDGLLASWSTRTSTAAPTSPSPRSRSTIDDAPAMGIFRFDRDGQIVAFEEKPNARAARRDRPEHSARRDVRRRTPPDKPFVASMGDLRLLARRAARDARAGRRDRLRPRDHPGGARHATGCNAYLFRGYWADVGTVDVVLRREHHAHAAAARRSSFYDPRRPIYTHPRFLPGSRLSDCTVRDAIVAEGCYLDRCDDRGVGRRHPHARSSAGATIRRSVLLGADYYEADDDGAGARRRARGSASAATSCSIA